MGRKSLEERKKEFVEKQTPSDHSSFVPKKTLKEIAAEECKKAGFTLRNDTSVIYAICNSKEESDRFTAFLLKRFGQESNGIKRIPFSYGYSLGTEAKQQLKEKSEENKEAEDYSEDERVL